MLKSLLFCLSLLISSNCFAAQKVVGDLEVTGNMKISSIASGTQCLHANSSGTISGTGSDCGSGGGGGNTLKIIGSVGSGNGYTDPKTVTPDYIGQIGVGISYTVPLLYAAGSTSTGDWYQPFNFTSGIGSIGNSVFPETNADIQQITWQVNASVPSLYRSGDSVVTFGNRSSSPYNSGAGVCVQNMTVDSKGLATESSDNSVVASCMNHVPKNRIPGLIPGYSMLIFNTDVNDNKGLAIASPGLSGIDGGNYSGLIIDFINRKTRIPLWKAGVFQPEDVGVLKTITVASGGSGYSVNDELNVVQSGNSTGKILVATISGSAVTSVSISPVVPGRGYSVANGVSTSSGSLQTAIVHAGGTGYVIGDTITVVQSGGASGTAYVLHVTSTGVVDSLALGNNNLAYSVKNADGTGYHTATGLSTTGGTGSGLTVDITTTGSGGTGATVNITAVNNYSDSFSVDPSNGNTFVAGALNLDTSTATTPAIFDSSKNIISGSYSGNTTKVVTNTGTNTSGSLTKWDSSGNLIAAAIIPGTLTDGKLCSYTASGTALNCTTTGGSGTVTNTGGNLTSNAVVLGAGTVDTKVVAGITTDGTSVLNLGVNTTTIGKVKMFGNTSGDATIQPAAVAGTSTVLTLPAASDTLVGKATTDTLTNKRVTPRVVTASDATSITPNSDNADYTQQTNTQSGGTLTINADGGTPTNGQSWTLIIKSTNVQTYSWNSVFVGGTNALPTASTGSSKIDYVKFIYSTINSKWNYVASANGF